jgi:hypothetical protein
MRVFVPLHRNSRCRLLRCIRPPAPGSSNNIAQAPRFAADPYILTTPAAFRHVPAVRHGGGIDGVSTLARLTETVVHR